jgi:hypothetical protein
MHKCGRELAVLAVLALAVPGTRADDSHGPPAPDPDPGFLEFLGSVDRLAEVNPDYLSQGSKPSVPKPVTPPSSPPNPPPPPPPPRQPPPAAANLPGVHNYG